MITRMSGRPREFDEATVLGRAMEAFWATGYEGTSLSDLVETSGVKKGSLYAAFGDKRRIYLRALQAYVDGLIGSAAEALSGSGSAKRRLASYLRVSANRVAAGDRRGCFLCNAATDVAIADPEVGRVVRLGLEKLERLFADTIGDTMSKSERSATARQLLAIYLGIQALARGGYSAASIGKIIDKAL